jgi:hypothetical protein
MIKDIFGKFTIKINHFLENLPCTVKEARGKVSFDSQNDKYCTLHNFPVMLHLRRICNSG